MIDLRDMELLVSLARHRHFARAANECGLSQPAFSMRIRSLEAALDTVIVRRGNRFEGFTEEGEIVLRWARRMLDDARAMRQEIRSAKGAVVGALNIGTIPTALTYTARIPVMMSKAHPGVIVRIHSATSLQILQGIEDGTYDAGVTYEDGVAPDAFTAQSLYDERYVLIAPKSIAPRKSGSASWTEAADLPLSLLVPQMQNRRILDNLFAEIGTEPRVVSETNAFSACLVLVREGFAATIVPDELVSGRDLPKAAVVLPLVEPDVCKKISLIHARRAHVLPTVQALVRVLAGQ